MKATTYISTFIAISFFIYLTQTAISYTQSNSLPTTADHQDFTIPLAAFGGGTVLNIKFIPNNIPKLTYTLIECSFNSQPTGTRIPLYYYGMDPGDYTNIDLQAAWLGKTQYVNLNVPGPTPTNLYVTLFNLDPSSNRFTINYNLQVQQSSSYQCAPCQNGGLVASSSSCQCNCMNGYEGQDCSLSIHSMNSQQQVVDQLAEGQFRFFRFNKQYGKITFKVKSENKEDLTIYFQYKQFDGEVAGYLNAFNSGVSTSYNLNSAKPQLSALDVLNQKDLLMTITRSTPGTTQFSVTLQSTQSKQSTNILLIVLLVLGAVIAILICAIIVFLIIKFKYSGGEQIVHAVDAQHMESINDKLSSNQINNYFPEYIESKLMMLNMQDSSCLQIKKPSRKDAQDKQYNDRDCVICLCPVQSDEPARITYCNHVFHSMCLINWFKKQRNCPYCRSQFNRQNTQKAYKQLVAANGNKVLKGDDLIKAILTKKQSQSKIKGLSVHVIQ